MPRQLEEQAEQVWLKGTPIPDKDENGNLKWPPHIWRRDFLGKPIKHDEYGNRETEVGWEKHHVISVAKGGSDELENLKPLNWKDNVRLGG